MTVYVTIPQPKVPEGSSFTATAYFRDGETASAPSALKYRVDDVTNNIALTDWTSVSPGESVSISITSTENKIQAEWNRYEKRRLTVSAEPDATNQTRGFVDWTVENLGWLIT